MVPPGGQYAYPTLAPASLQGYLRRSGVSTRVLDLNILGFDDVTSPECVDALLARLATEASALRAQHAEHPDLVHLIDLLLEPSSRRWLHGLGPRLRDLEAFRHETAYAVTLHHLAWFTNLIELLYPPLRFKPGSLVGGMFGRVRSMEHLLTVPTPFDDSCRTHLDTTDWRGATVVGFSAFSFDQLVFALRVAPLVRERAPQAQLVLGGNCLGESQLPVGLQAILVDAFDFVVVGDGEVPLLRIVEAARGVGDREDVPNALIADGAGPRRTPSLYKFRFEIDGPADFSGLPMDLYCSPAPVLPFRFSNGCDWGKCTFCSESADRGAISSWRAYKEPPATQVARELGALQRQWETSVFVNCSSLVTAVGCADIGAAIAAEGLDVRWFAMVRSEHDWTPERIRAASHGGASALNFGIESMHPRVNRMMRKGIRLEEVPGMLAAFREHGVDVTVYTLVNFPTEAFEEYDEHLRALTEHFGSYDILFRSTFMLVADAPVAQQPERFGIDRDDVARQLARLRDRDFPIYMLPDPDSGGPAFRWPGDQLEEKLDAHHAFLLDLVMHTPMYFDRNYEIASRGPFWEPEYNMICRHYGGKRLLPGLSLTDLLRSEVRFDDAACFERLDAHRCAVTVPTRGVALYYGQPILGLLEDLWTGASFHAAFRRVIDERDPSALELLDLYERVHRELRWLGVLHATPPRARPETTPAATGAGVDASA